MRISRTIVVVFAILAVVLMAQPIGELLLDPSGSNRVFALLSLFGTKNFLTWRATLLDTRYLFPFAESAAFTDPYIIPALLGRLIFITAPVEIAASTAVGVSVAIFLVSAFFTAALTAATGLKSLLQNDPLQRFWVAVGFGLLATLISIAGLLFGPCSLTFISIPLAGLLALTRFVVEPSVTRILPIPALLYVAVITAQALYFALLFISIIAFIIIIYQRYPVRLTLTCTPLLLLGLYLASIPLSRSALVQSSEITVETTSLSPQTIEIHPRLFEVLDIEENNHSLAIIGPQADNALFSALFQLESSDSVTDGSRRVVNSPFGITPTEIRAVLDFAKSFPSDEAIQALANIPTVHYLLYVGGSALDHRAFVGELRKLQHSVKILARDRAGNYLLRFDPTFNADNTVIHLLPVTDHKRYLEFSIRVTPENAIADVSNEQPRSLEFRAPTNETQRPHPRKGSTAEGQLIELFRLHPDGKWKRVRIELPASKSKLQPQTVIMQQRKEPLLPAVDFEIKELRIRNPWQLPEII